METEDTRPRAAKNTNGVECVLYWGDGEYKRHIDLGQHDNVATFPLAPGYSQFAAFCCEADMDDRTGEPMAMPSAFTSDDDSVTHDEVKEQSTLPWSQHWTPPPRPTTIDNSVTTTVEFNLNCPYTPTSVGGRLSQLIFGHTQSGWQENQSTTHLACKTQNDGLR